MSRRSSAGRGQPSEDSAETDLIKLQGQYRKAKKDKQAYTKKTEALIIRDKLEIQRLQDEHEELLCKVSERTDASDVKDLTSLLAREDRIDEELEAERAKVASLKDQILKWERKLEEQRTQKETTHCDMKTEKRNLLKTTRSVEKKLDRGCKYFNEIMVRNRELREELKLMQADKKQFLNVKSRLEKELHAIRKDISNLMTQCTEAFSARVKTREKTRMLMDQNEKDLAQYVKERGNLERQMSHYHKVEVFRDTKAAEGSDHSKVKHNKLDSKELGPEDFEKVVKKILAETQESDLDTLVKNFIRMEEENYTLLKFINDQQNKAEAIRRQISELHKERETFVAEEQRQQEQHQARWNKMSVKQEAVDQQLEVYQCVEYMEKLLDQLKEGVKSLLKTSCDSSVICDELDFADGNQEKVMVEYLIKVENRVNELLTLQSYHQFEENSSQLDIDSLSTISGHLLGVTPPPVDHTAPAATPAPVDDPDLVESVLLEAKEPMNQEELQTLVDERIQRK